MNSFRGTGYRWRRNHDGGTFTHTLMGEERVPDALLWKHAWLVPGWEPPASLALPAQSQARGGLL